MLSVTFSKASTDDASPSDICHQTRPTSAVHTCSHQHRPGPSAHGPWYNACCKRIGTSEHRDTRRDVVVYRTDKCLHSLLKRCFKGYQKSQNILQTHAMLALMKKHSHAIRNTSFRPTSQLIQLRLFLGLHPRQRLLFFAVRFFHVERVLRLHPLFYMGVPAVPVCTMLVCTLFQDMG